MPSLSLRLGLPMTGCERGADGGSTPFSPSQYGTLLAAWEADTGVSATGADVTGWSGKYGTSYTLTASKNYPQLVSAGWGSKPAIQFNSPTSGGSQPTTQILESAALGAAVGDSDVSVVLAVISEAVGASADQTFWSFSNPANNSDYYSGSLRTSDVLQVSRPAANDVLGVSSVTLNSRYIFGVDMKPGEVDLYQNGTLAVDGDTGLASTSGINTFFVGGRRLNTSILSQGCKAKIAAIWVFDGAMTDPAGAVAKMEELWPLT